MAARAAAACAGIGKLQFAQHLAQGFLCESPQPNGEPCALRGLHLVSQGNHPDYRIVLPEALAGEAPGAADDAKAADADEGGKKTRAPSKEIKIEQVRALLDFCGSVRTAAARASSCCIRPRRSTSPRRTRC